MNAQIEKVRDTGQGQYKKGNTFYTLDGSDIKAWLEAQGYKVAENRDAGRNGIAITECGMQVSTNGYISKAK